MALWPNGESWRLGMYHLFAGSKKKKYFMANKYLSSVSSVGQEKNLEVSTSLTISLVQYHHHQSLVSTYAEHSL